MRLPHLLSVGTIGAAILGWPIIAGAFFALTFVGIVLASWIEANKPPS